MYRLFILLFIMQNIIYGSCLSQEDIELEIEPKSEFVNLLILKVDKLPFKEIEKINLGLEQEKNELLQFKDLNFDGIKEIVLDISSHDVKKEYLIYSLKCNTIIEFNPSILKSFKIDKKEKTLTEYTKNIDGFKPIINLYCLYNKTYSLCKKDEYIEKNLSKISKFDKNGDLIHVEYFFNNKFFLKDSTISKKNLTQYNNIAYYLEQAGAYKESIYLLEKIIEKYPNRTVAYINLGDSYLKNGNKIKAIKNYKIYVNQMKDKNKEKKIPKRVLEVIDNSKTPNKSMNKQKNTSKIEPIKEEEKTFFTKLLELFGSSIPTKNIMQS